MKHSEFSIQHRVVRVMLAMGLFSFFVALPAAAFAADFVPLAPIPNLATKDGTSLEGYINSLFLLIISVAAMLAVIRIVIGGFQYMTQTQSTSATSNARLVIRDAVVGLILLLSIYLILSVVNPQILNLSALNFERLGPSEATQTQIDQNRKEAADARQKAEDLLGQSNLKSAEVDGKTVQFNVVDINELSRLEQNAYKTVCRSRGGTIDTWNTTTCTKPSGETYQSTKLKWWSYTEFVCKKGEGTEVKESMNCVIPGN